MTVVARDLSHRMSQKTVTGEFKPGTLEAVVREVATRNNWTGDLATITCDPNPQLTENNDLKQVNETDYHYLQRLAERYGARAFVEYNDGKSRFYFVSNRSLLEAKPLGRIEYCRGLNKLIEFKYSSVAARSAKQYVATAVDPVSGEVKTAQGDPASAPPAAPTAAAPPAAPPTPTPAPGQPSDPDLAAARRHHRPDARPRASRRGPRRRHDPLRAKGKVDDPRARPVGRGRLVRREGGPHLERHADARGPEDQAQALLLRDEVHGDEVDVLPYRPQPPRGQVLRQVQRLRRRHRRQGAARPGEGERPVRVRAATSRSGRARASRPGTSSSRRSGAAVWVEFEAGDTGYPLWVGTWYPQGSVPPEADKPSAPGRVVHTPAGHVVELSDEDGKEKLVIRHKLDSFVSIDEKGSLLAANQNGSLPLPQRRQGRGERDERAGPHGHARLGDGRRRRPQRRLADRDRATAR